MPSQNSQLNSALNIRLKINAENNVIFLKCDGFESEIFMPTVIAGRLSIINVIPQRRCKCINTSHIVAKNTASPTDCQKSKESNFRASTPTSNHGAQNASNDSLVMLDEFEDEVGSRQNTPEPMRGAAATQANDKSLQIGQIINYRNGASNGTQASWQIVEIVEDSNSIAQEKSSTSHLTSRRRSNGGIQTGNLSPIQLTTSANISLTEQHQWQGTLPTRTYARRTYAPNSSFSSQTSTQSAHRRFLQQSTEGIKANEIVVIKRRKKKSKIPKIDEKIAISPARLKQQIQVDENLTQKYQELRKEYKLRQLEKDKISAFDLFTTPTSKSKCISREFLKLFQARCLDKGSSTYPKYKKLAKLTIENEENTESTKSSTSMRTILELDTSSTSQYTAQDFM